jgi:site-specific DNA-methyltransferase (adenine-specific)
VSAVVTDPPYDLNFMNRAWDRTGIAFLRETWAAAYDLLPPGGYLLALGGTRTYHRMACAIEDAGFRITDCVMWLHGQGFPKNRLTQLKPAVEPIVMAQKPVAEKNILANIAAHGTGAINVDACRVGTSKSVPASGGKERERDGWGMQSPTQSDGGFNPNIGRWPANIVHDGSDEVEAVFAEFEDKGGGFGVRGGKRQMAFGMGAGGVVGYGDTGTASRFFYCAKASKAERDGSAHVAVKPLALMRWLVRLVTPPGGTVLDPFCGTGTTLAAAIAEGFGAIGVEREAAYVADTLRRLDSLRPAEAAAE